jgi:hypothetical protein
LDANVRDTWEVPRDRVTVDERRWRETLLPMLDILRAELGLAPDGELSAELHSMLVYEPGQFFRRHRDSEKSEGMLATLVVTLPSAFTGGDLVIEQQGTKVTDQGSPAELSFVAFYSDCEHEVLPVTDGFRITLTYNLVAKGRTGPDAAAFAMHRWNRRRGLCTASRRNAHLVNSSTCWIISIPSKDSGGISSRAAMLPVPQ